MATEQVSIKILADSSNAIDQISKLSTNLEQLNQTIKEAFAIQTNADNAVQNIEKIEKSAKAASNTMSDMGKSIPLTTATERLSDAGDKIDRIGSGAIRTASSLGVMDDKTREIASGITDVGDLFDRTLKSGLNPFTLAIAGLTIAIPVLMTAFKGTKMSVKELSDALENTANAQKAISDFKLLGKEIENLRFAANNPINVKVQIGNIEGYQQANEKAKNLILTDLKKQIDKEGFAKVWKSAMPDDESVKNTIKAIDNLKTEIQLLSKNQQILKDINLDKYMVNFQGTWLKSKDALEKVNTEIDLTNKRINTGSDFLLKNVTGNEALQKQLVQLRDIYKASGKELNETNILQTVLGIKLTDNAKNGKELTDIFMGMIKAQDSQNDSTKTGVDLAKELVAKQIELRNARMAYYTSLEGVYERDKQKLVDAEAYKLDVQKNALNEINKTLGLSSNNLPKIEMDESGLLTMRESYVKFYTDLDAMGQASLETVQKFDEEMQALQIKNAQLNKIYLDMQIKDIQENQTEKKVLYDNMALAEQEFAKQISDMRKMGFTSKQSVFNNVIYGQGENGESVINAFQENVQELIGISQELSDELNRNLEENSWSWSLWSENASAAIEELSNNYAAGQNAMSIASMAGADVLNRTGGVMADVFVALGAGADLSAKQVVKALKWQVAETLKAISKEASMRAIFETAMGLASMVINPAAATGHFMAAATYGIVAGGAGLAAGAMGAGGEFNQSEKDREKADEEARKRAEDDAKKEIERQEKERAKLAEKANGTAATGIQNTTTINLYGDLVKSELDKMKAQQDALFRQIQIAG